MELEFRIRNAQGTEQTKSLGDEQTVSADRIRPTGGTMGYDATASNGYGQLSTKDVGEDFDASQPGRDGESPVRDDGYRETVLESNSGKYQETAALHTLGNEQSAIVDGVSDTTGWEREREFLLQYETGTEFVTVPVSANDIQAVPPDAHRNGDVGDIIGGVFSLANDISKTVDAESEHAHLPHNHPKRSSAEREKRRALGQRDDDEEQTPSWHQTM